MAHLGSESHVIVLYRIIQSSIWAHGRAWPQVAALPGVPHLFDWMAAPRVAFPVVDGKACTADEPPVQTISSYRVPAITYHDCARDSMADGDYFLYAVNTNTDTAATCAPPPPPVIECTVQCHCRVRLHRRCDRVRPSPSYFVPLGRALADRVSGLAPPPHP